MRVRCWGLGEEECEGRRLVCWCSLFGSHCDDACLSPPHSYPPIHPKPQENFDIHFALPLPEPKLFGVNEYNPLLNAEADARGVKRYHQTVLASVDGAKREATFKRIGGEGEGTEMTLPFAMLHVTPPMSAPAVLKTASKLLNESGYVDVDKATLQHKSYPNIFALGDSADASALPTSKTMAAVAAMVPVVTHNLQRVMRGLVPSAEYDGYSSCPIPLSLDKLLLT